ncbi:MAG: hypothetical protein WKF71_11795 [Pyrinomonadaceae bacterium]
MTAATTIRRFSPKNADARASTMSISQSAVREFQVNDVKLFSRIRTLGGRRHQHGYQKREQTNFTANLFYYNRNNRNGARNPLAIPQRFWSTAFRRLVAHQTD